MPKPTAQGFWTGYAKVNDDIRHTYEQVFYGRKTTDELNELEVPGMAKPTVQPATPAPKGQEPGAPPPPPHAHADLYTRIWGPSPTQPGTPEPTAQQSHAPENAPQVEDPKIQPPRQGGDLTPE